MVSPITALPVVDEIYKVNGPFPGSYRRYKPTRFGQKKPYTLPTDYRAHYAKTILYETVRWPNPFGQIMNWGVGYAPANYRAEFYYNSSDLVRELESRLASKLNSEIRGSTAGLGVSLVESHQAFDMIIKRTSQTLRFARALKRFQFRKAWWILKDPKYHVSPKDYMKPKLPSGLVARAGAKNFANNYLEYYFGWSPLIKDIQDSFEVLDSPIPFGEYKVKSGFKRPITQTSQGSVGDMWNGLTRVATEHVLRVYGSAGTSVEVTNPNALLASNMGLTSPWSLVWEVIPFSFVVDWFYNVGSYLEQFEVVHPFLYQNPWYGWVVKDDADFLGEYWWHNVQYDKVKCYTTMTSTGRSTVMLTVSLHRKRVPLFEDKLGRAAAAVSLLVQALR